MTAGRMRGPTVGELDKLVTVKAWEDVPSGFALAQQYDDPQQAWASLMPIGAALFYSGQQVGQEVTHRLIAWRTSTLNGQVITARHVVEHEGLRYRIRRASDMNGERVFVVLDLELLGEAT